MTMKRSHFKKIKKELVKYQKRAKEELHQTHPHVKKLLKQTGIELYTLREKSAKLLSIGAFTATVMLTPPTDMQGFPIPQEIIDKLQKKEREDASSQKNSFLLEVLREILPVTPRPLTKTEEQYLEELISNTYAVDVKANLEGQHLNTTYGKIGIEQHLRRFPQDTLELHQGPDHIQRSGMARGLGAWGYFCQNQHELTTEIENRERWYAVVQTMYLPQWNTNTVYLRDWYKYRKVLIVNTLNGNAVVADIADAGPAAWTGKQFGGSPEVMDTLGGNSYKKGNVVIMFVDDPENLIPLGPVNAHSDEPHQPKTNNIITQSKDESELINE